MLLNSLKLQVLREVKKKLKREGIFIIIDGYQRDRAARLSPSEKVMKKLVEKGFSVDRFECIKDVEGYMREEYSIVEVNDFTQHILPTAISTNVRAVIISLIRCLQELSINFYHLML